EKYIEKIQDAFQITDIIRARVISQNYNEYNLSTSGKHLGVLYADCVVCGTPLDKIGYNKLRCERCGNTETRKLAEDYRNISEALKF
ncbi:MAG: exosome complex RNA-binding protein Csl4, partial [Candidatus Hermodarchaeota archaeon]